MGKKAIFWLGAVAVAIGAGGFLAQSNYLSKVTPAPTQAQENRPQAAAVEAVKVKTGEVIDDIRAVGTLQPNEAVAIAPEIAGRIASIPFGEGVRVKEGDILIELDPIILKAELDKARSDLTLSSANRQRADTLAERGSGTTRARDEANAAYRASQVALSLAEARLQKSTLQAPFSGVLGLRAVSPGAYVAPGQRLFDLVQVDLLKVDFRVPEMYANKIKVGQSVLVSPDAALDEAFEGKIYAIDPLIDVNGRAIRLRAHVPNTDGRLSPGFFARLRVVTERRANAIIVPESAIFPLAGRTLVYKVVNGRAVQTDVVLGQRMPGEVEVRQGLTPTDVVVTSGQQRLRNGMAVRIVDTAPGT
ncbi:MAG: efflux RND transporter periplasmic adaptor subunit [Beijerinckiaceae bacterium]|nr:efflux RND transporter periplasmic adaptor subunit [Beijerinckiaceae bacterium]